MTSNPNFNGATTATEAAESLKDSIRGKIGKSFIPALVLVLDGLSNLIRLQKWSSPASAPPR